MAQRTSDPITVLLVTAAGASITTQVWASGATLAVTGVVGFLAVTNIAWTIDTLRRHRTKHTVACPKTGCPVRISMAGVKPDEQTRLITFAVDHTQHGSAA
ncbi:hypothetical protein [Streptomyces sp. NPDC056069]|uniref:hypothetical protein n=1 Tax=Streptomyces sp. NPDC056069 TaxID=3345702 RepID=UPI0035D8727C